jgi:NTE family protein
MTSGDAKPRSPRRALVFGGGGVLGGTWAVGALTAWQEETGLDPVDVDMIVGTSAGSVLAALVACGVSTDELITHYRDEPVTTGPLAGYEWDPDRATGGKRPGRPKLRGPGSPALIRSSLRNLGQLPATAVLSAFLPEGGKSLERVGHLIDAVTPLGEWSAHPNLWVVATDYSDGHRVVFGRPGAPVAPLASAVMASCAIPGWFTPVDIAGRTYIDGGAVSATSVDVLAHTGVDEVYVIAPMVSFETDSPSSIQARLERRWRAQVTKVCRDEMALLRAAGASVYAIGPGPQDLEAIGANLMDARRRQLVLDTSLRTSTQVWHAQLGQSLAG